MRLLGSTLAGVVALAAAATAPAAEAAGAVVTYDRQCQSSQNEHCYEDDPVVRIRSAGSEANDLRLEPGGVVRDVAAPLRAGDGCRQVDAQTVACDVPDTWEVELGGGDDRFADAAGATTTVDGGPGDDELLGGGGPDELRGGGGRDALRGGANDDTLSDGDGTRGPVDADVLDGGDGSDTVSYEGHPGPVTADLSAPGPAGEPGEGDLVAAVENAIAGAGPAVLVGGDGPNRLQAGAGGGRLVGHGGDDRLDASRARAAADLDGGAGDDVLSGGAGRDRLIGGEGDDVLAQWRGDAFSCGAGDDIVAPPWRPLPLDCEWMRPPGFDAWPDVWRAPVAVRARSITLRLRCIAVCDQRLVLTRGRRVLGRVGTFRMERGRRTLRVRLSRAGRRAARLGQRVRLVIVDLEGESQVLPVVLRR